MLKKQNKIRPDNKILSISQCDILPNPNQPRKRFDYDELEGLAQSIRANGILQPLIVRELENGKYELVAGERRLRAARLIGMTKALAKELGLSGITVNCVSPGVILTDMTSHFDENTMNELKNETPLNRIGTPEDVAGAVAFLVSADGDFITGQDIPVNGGMY